MENNCLNIVMKKRVFNTFKTKRFFEELATEQWKKYKI